MKKLIAFVLALMIVVLGMFGCSNNESSESNTKTETKSLYAQGLEVIQMMSEMTRTEEYVDILIGDSNIKTVIQDISTGDYSAPKAVYAITVSDENLATMAELDSFGNVSKELKNLMKKRIFSSLISQINGRSGIDKLAAASVCTAGKTFVNENATDNVIYLYTYENANPVAVTFTVGEDGAVSANGVFVLYDEFTCDSADEIKAFFNDIAEVTEVQPEK
jgi:hypothetical protein